MTEKRSVTYVELDVDFCQLTHGSSPCTATGEPCYNTLSTCQDRENFCGLAFTTPTGTNANGVVPIFESYDTGDTPEDLTYWYNETTGWVMGTDESPSNLMMVHTPTADNNDIAVATWNGYNADDVTVKALLWSELAAANRGGAGVVAHVAGTTTFTGYAAILEDNAGAMEVSLYRANAHNIDDEIRVGTADAALVRAGSVAVDGVGSTWRWIKLEISGASVNVRTWLYGDDEPTTWDIEYTDAAPLDPGSTGVINAHCRTDGTIKVSDFYATTSGEQVTLRWVMDTLGNPSDIDAIPALMSVDYTPATLSLGQDLGERSSISANFRDFPWSDVGDGYDPYVDQRSYDAYDQGTYWAKFRARQLYIQGRPFRLIRGTADQAYADMTTYHFLADAFSGPDAQTGTFKIIGKDVLKFVDSERAKAPLLSDGYLLVALGTADTLVYLPTGIGINYPETGYIGIGGTEICSYVNNGNDTLSVTRAQLNTEASEHDAEERVQWVLAYEGEDAADIIYDLLVTYGDIDPDLIDLTAWQAETAAYLENVYSAYIAEPTSVKQLISELIQEAALILWWDPVDNEIKLRVLRGIDTTSRSFNCNVILDKSLTVEEQHSTRLTQVWVYYGRRNPLKSMDDTDNYQSTYAEVDLQVESDHGVSSIKIIYSRWIAIGGREAAERIAQIFISRFKIPPRKFNFSLFYDEDVSLGEGYNISSWTLQDETGALETVPIQVTRVTPFPDRFEVEAQEQLFDYETSGAGDVRTITFNSSTANVNLRDIHDNIYPDIEQEGSPTFESPSISIVCIIETGVFIYSTNVNNPSFDVGDWPEDTPITLIVRGTIVGRGGDGGHAGSNTHHYGYPGENGSTALYVRRPIRLEIDDSTGRIWGGGGGGAGGSIKDTDKIAGGGGGGAGMPAGDGGGANGPGNEGEPGTLEFGGDGGPQGTSQALPGAPGGDAGEDGGDNGGGTFGPVIDGGTAGYAIDGISHVDKIGTGDVRGLEVN